MKQVYQSYRSGELAVVDVPAPRAGAGRVVVRTAATVVSAGTERAMIELARKSLVGKALARPDLVRQVIGKVRTEGFAEAYRQTTGRLETPVALGYSAAGVVAELGQGVDRLSVGDRVAYAGAGVAGHAELNAVPAHLCVRVPEPVPFDGAAFVALGGIALEAVRVARVGLGDRVVVIGLGLIGQLAVQILSAAGCHVLGADLAANKVALARAHGAEAGVAIGQDDVTARVRAFSHGAGADAAIILASGASNEPLELAAEVVRERGRVVATGLVGLDLPRKPFYEKELEIIVSRGWGPGMYDAQYTERGLDYPLPYARWTASRNLGEFLELLGRGAVQVEHLITHRFPLDRALDAYELITRGTEPSIGVVLTYPYPYPEAGPWPPAHTVQVPPPARTRARPATVGLGLIGAGLFAKGTLLPAVKSLDGVALRGVATATGLTGRDVAARAGFGYATTDYHQLLADDTINAVLIATRHGWHARMVADALAAGKHVFVEKPLALSLAELATVAAARRAAARNAVVMVGFNRRFSPCAVQLRRWLGDPPGPLLVNCRVNAGRVAADSWVHDPAEGGGRIVGEVCHFVDLAQALCGSNPVRVQADTLADPSCQPSDNLAGTLRFANGSLATIVYVATGDKSFPRERVEVFGGGSAAVLDNFRTVSIRTGGRERKVSQAGADRGHRAELEAFVAAVKAGGPGPVPFEDYLATTLTTFALEEALRTGGSVAVEPWQAVA